MDKMQVLFTFLTGEQVALSKEKISAFCRWVKLICIILRICLSSMHMMDLQECREACGGQGLKTDNRVGPAKAEYDVQLTFEGDNNVLMQQVGSCSHTSIQSLIMVLSLFLHCCIIEQYSI